MDNDSYIPKFDNENQVSAEINIKTRPDVARYVIQTENRYSILGGIVAILLIILGIILIFLGVNGAIDFDLQIEKITAKLVNCSPGFGCVLLGVLVLILLKPKIKISG